MLFSLRGRVQAAAAVRATEFRGQGTRQCSTYCSSRMTPLSTEACPRLTPASMWPAIARTYEQAQSSGAASKTETTFKLVPDEQTGITFVIREASALKKKPPAPQASQPSQQVGEQLQGGQDAGRIAEGGQQQQARPRKWHDPFLPPEPQLLVGELSDSHLLVLNKFNVVRHHVLVVTKAFQAQHDPLNAHDLGAVWTVLKGMSQGRHSGGLAFYNSGEFSGRSQPHKHLQVVPLPFIDTDTGEGQQQQHGMPGQHSQDTDGMGPPVEPLVKQAAKASGAALFEPFPVRQLPYVCYAAMLTDGSGRDPSPQELERTSMELLRQACPNAPIPSSPPPPSAPSSSDPLDLPDSPPQPPPGAPSYNTIITSQFMLTVPRSAEAAEGIAINALGYAGTILVKSEEHVAQVEQSGPSNLLRRLGCPWLS
uniref:HIT domain-containing protein n=1 Tax=Dunaliella tertiolecta TaxID=3047 RepID=A0A7S3QRK2_DUNTE|mmetsp:Transcript_18452/g.51772  ORF Transcript_18452/g.51772 Transcript_18452/m.51772 type:complete len:424 (+) Transcript_18452:85-1356(+)